MATPMRLVPLRVVVGGTLCVHGFARLFGGPNRKVPTFALSTSARNTRSGWQAGASTDSPSG